MPTLAKDNIGESGLERWFSGGTGRRHHCLGRSLVAGDGQEYFRSRGAHRFTVRDYPKRPCDYNRCKYSVLGREDLG